MPLYPFTNHKKNTKNMAKIGVVTYSQTTDNYGQVLQFLATKLFLEELGHEVRLLRPRGHNKDVAARILRRVLGRLGLSKIENKNCLCLSPKEMAKQELFEKWAKVTEKQENEHPREFEKFRRIHFKIDKATYENILHHDYDAFCVGSDQTWSAPSELYMLGWVQGKFKKITIAPSVGHRKYSDEEIDKITPWINSFDLITVREQNGIDLVKRAGRTDSIKVLDPTLMVTSNRYDSYAKMPDNAKPYILVYLLGGEISVSVEKILGFCNKNGYEVKYIESQGRNENVEKVYATIEEWLGLVKGASYVMTNSFHGMAFSMIYHKPFLVFPLIGIMEDMNQRIFNLAEQTKLNSRVYNGKLETLFNPLDWAYSDSIRKANKDILTQKITNLLV